MSFKTLEAEFVKKITTIENGIVTIAKEIEPDLIKGEAALVNLVKFIAANNGIEEAAAKAIITYINKIQTRNPFTEAIIKLAVAGVNGIEIALNFIIADQGVIIQDANSILNYITGSVNKLPTATATKTGATQPGESTK